MEPTLSLAVRPDPGHTVNGRCNTRLAPDREFPAELAALTLVELQVLHSRIVCQLEHEHLELPDGPHPVTRDRHEEIVVELGARTVR
ncbi:hypothetical protein ACH9EU_05535 [Kocuria sp. M1R5S2]|uniref:hypothetical protein n=1 Tax=Kocuria rhizosphaerae TaxID=3376285 RepID=UPI0037ADB5A3